MVSLRFRSTNNQGLKKIPTSYAHGGRRAWLSALVPDQMPPAYLQEVQGPKGPKGIRDLGSLCRLCFAEHEPRVSDCLSYPDVGGRSRDSAEWRVEK